MLVLRCALERHRLTVLASVTRPRFQSGLFQGGLAHNQYRALVDTGAQRTVLSRSVIAEQKLMRTGHMEFAGIHGPQTHSRYLASIALWAKRIDKNESVRRYEDAELSLFTIEDPFEVVDMQDNVNFDLILGFDVLKGFSFSFDTNSLEFEIVVQR